MIGPACLECDTITTATDRPGIWWCETCDAARGARGQRVCSCGCGEGLAGRRARTKFVDERHKQRDYRRRVNEAARAAGVPARLSLESVRAPNPTSERNGDAQKRRTPRKRTRRQGVSVYLPTLQAAKDLATWIRMLRPDGGRPELEPAEDALERAITRRRHADHDQGGRSD